MFTVTNRFHSCCYSYHFHHTYSNDANLGGMRLVVYRWFRLCRHVEYHCFYRYSLFGDNSRYRHSVCSCIFINTKLLAQLVLRHPFIYYNAFRPRNVFRFDGLLLVVWDIYSRSKFPIAVFNM